MKKILLLSMLASASVMAVAQERGRVLSSTPVMEQIAVPRQVCGNETVHTGPRTTGGGAILGAIAGGAAGNAVGKGSGRTAATALGLIGGAVLGNQIEGNGRPEYQNVQRCSTQTAYESRTTGYDVVYEYAGRRYTTRTQTDPGRYITVTVQAEEPRGFQRYDDRSDGRSGYSEDPVERGVVTSPYYSSPPPPGPTVIEYDNDGRRPYEAYPAPRQNWR